MKSISPLPLIAVLSCGFAASALATPLDLSVGTHTLAGAQYTVTHSAAGAADLGDGRVSLRGDLDGFIEIEFLTEVWWTLNAAPGSGIHNALKDNPINVLMDSNGTVHGIVADPDNEIDPVSGFGTNNASFNFRYRGGNRADDMTVGSNGPNGNDYLSRNQNWEITASGTTLRLSSNFGNGDFSAFQISVPESGATFALFGLGLCGVFMGHRHSRRSR